MDNKQKFKNLLLQLNNTIGKIDSLLDTDEDLLEIFNYTQGYPFSQSIDELSADVSQWTHKLFEKLQ